MNGEKLYSFSSITNLGQLRKRKQIQQIFDNLLPDLRDSAVILEIGPGRGEFAEIATKRGYSYVGIEPSKSLDSELQSRGITVLDSPLSAIQMKNDSVDLSLFLRCLGALG